MKALMKTDMLVAFVSLAFIGFIQAQSENQDGDIFAGSLTATAACSMDPDLDDCGENQQNWYFDSNSNLCTIFTYRGCNKSPNNFATIEECEAICVNAQQAPQGSSEDVDANTNSNEVVSETLTETKISNAENEPISQQNDESEKQQEEIAQEEEEESLEDTLHEQEILIQKLNMADRDDMLTLTSLMQDPNMDIGEVIRDPDSQDEDGANFKGVLVSEQEVEEGMQNYDNDDDNNENANENPFGIALSDDENLEMQAEDSEDDMRLQHEEYQDENEGDNGNASDMEPNSNVLETEEENNDAKYDEEEDALEETEREQDALRRQFSMADKDDFLALEEIMQNQNMEQTEIVEDQGQTEDGVYAGYLYKQGYQPERENSDEQVESENKMEGDFVENEEDQLQPEEPGQHLDRDIDQSELSESEADDTTQDDDDEKYVQETLALQKQLQEEYSMADRKDLLALEEMLQSENMDLAEILERRKINDVNAGDMEGVLEREDPEPVWEAYSPEQQPDQMTSSEDDYMSDNEEAGDNKDNGDYQEIDSDVRDENNDYWSDSDENEQSDFVEAAHNLMNNQNQYESDEQSNEEQSYESNEDSDEQDMNNVLSVEKRLEDQFGLANSADLLTLEELVQKPNINLMEMLPRGRREETYRNNRKGDVGEINEALSYASSFLGNDDQKDIEAMKGSWSQAIQRGEYDPDSMEKSDLDADFEELERRVRPTTKPMIALEKADYDDKQTLITLLHNDLLDFRKLKDTEPMMKRDKKRNKGYREKTWEWKKFTRFGDDYKRKGKKARCSLPKDTGLCKARILQWHYDPFVGTCLPFYYGGCLGNKNRFDTIGACLRKCGGSRDRAEKMTSPNDLDREDPDFRPPAVTIKSIVSGVFPKHVFKPAKVLSMGQEKIMRAIGSAMKHANEIHPIQISPFDENPFNDKQLEGNSPIPLKSVMFRWPIMRMIFDKRSRSGKILPPLARPEIPERHPMHPMPRVEVEERRRLPPVEKMAPPPPPLKSRLPPQPKEALLSSMRKNDFDIARENRVMHPLPPPHVREPARSYYEHSANKHFSPTYSKQFKAMSHHEDNRHHMTSDPKNKVNLIQVFVNKPHNEARAEPRYQNTMIKKHQFSKGHDYPYPMPFHHEPPFYPHHKPHPYNPHRSYPPHVYPPPMNSESGHFHMPPHRMRTEEREPMRDHYYHSHPHHPEGHHYHHRDSQRSGRYPQPWLQGERHGYPQERFPPQYQPEIRPSTSYPEVEDEEPEEQDLASLLFSSENQRDDDDVTGYRRGPGSEEEEVVVVTVPPGGFEESEEEPHYACLLPLSTGVCKAFVEKFYYNKDTKSCDLFFYGGCGGNANNFNSREACQQTCIGSTPVSTQEEETTTLPDDNVIYITSPVYEEDENNVQSSSEEKSRDDNKQDGVVEVQTEEEKEEDVSLVKDIKLDGQAEHIEVYAEPIAVKGYAQSELLVAVVCFVALAAAALVCLAGANLIKRKKTSKKDKVVEAVLASHFEQGLPESGRTTPRMMYYGHPPSETGPPPIGDLPKIHQDNLKPEP